MLCELVNEPFPSLQYFVLVSVLQGPYQVSQSLEATLDEAVVQS